ncbi:hypothetical protein ACFFQW_45875 [Umezawaea endophytica]|uniref:HTH cro/C1-type domain-containing protein n=1 Tax=Umezawaea endophytica TaxID=1654476 RepID=A0A9X3AJ14_9PSEU|nr:hypothetical protein [Umezawaea endophytica]MCS7483316.1 hypothetical protein [Umezawaea endophytica]
MASTRHQRGRLTSIADDDAGGPVTRVDNKAAISWLLTLHRLYAPDRALRTLEGLASALKTSAVPGVSPTTVSRWENRRTRMSLAAIRRFEELVGLSAGQLDAVVTSLEGGIPPRWHLPVNASAVLEKFLGGAVITAVEWVDFVRGLPRSRLRLSTSQWYPIVHRLLAEMAISIRWRYLLRLSALEHLHRYARADEALFRAISDFTADPACQVVVDPVALLAGNRRPAVTAKLLTMLASPATELELRGALIAWTTRLPWDDQHRNHVAAVACGHLLADSSSVPLRETAADLLATIPRGLLEPEVRRALDTSDHGHRATITHRLSPSFTAYLPEAERLLDAVTVAQTERHDDDPLVGRLIRQSLFSTDTDTRVYGANVLNSSPFRDTIADALDRLLADPARDSDPATSAALVDLLGSLGSERHRATLEALMSAQSTPSHLTAGAAFALAHLPGTTELSTWRRVLDGNKPRSDWQIDVEHRAVLYAVGMNQDRAGLHYLRTSTSTSSDVARRAHWWLRLPDAVMASARW